MTSHILNLGAASWDPARLRLVNDRGATVELTNKARDLMACLADAAGEAVAHETIVNTVWPEVPVEEAVITRTVAELRQAIGDRDEVVIRTVPKVGYQLVGTWVDVPDPPGPGLHRGHWILALLVLVLLTLMVLHAK